jgi:hypothetical protein
MNGRRRRNKGKINGHSLKADLAGEREGDPDEMQVLVGLEE